MKLNEIIHRFGPGGIKTFKYHH